MYQQSARHFFLSHGISGLSISSLDRCLEFWNGHKKLYRKEIELILIEINQYSLN